MSHLKYIFFDLDGTLVDSSKGIQESFEYSFKQLGKECPEESIIKSFMGPPLEVSFASVLEERQVPEAINYYRSFYKEKGIWGVRLYANPEETIIIGDTKFDMIGGKEVGISTLGVLWGFGSQKELLENGADLLANSPNHILKILKEHFS